MGEFATDSTLTFQQRKVVNIGWDTGIIKGMTVSIEAGSSDEDQREVRSAQNDGFATVTFPGDFEGDCHITVKGSKGGEQSGVCTVE